MLHYLLSSLICGSPAARLLMPFLSYSQEKRKVFLGHVDLWVSVRVYLDGSLCRVRKIVNISDLSELTLDTLLQVAFDSMMLRWI